MTAQEKIQKSQKSLVKSDSFPDLPAYSALWHSLQIEPIQGSGEKLTIAIAVKGNDGAVNIYNTASKKLFNCLCGDAEIANKLFSMVQLSISSAENHLNNRISLDDWISPIANISIGRSVDALGENIEDIFFQSLNLTSILGASSLVSKNRNKKEIDLRAWKQDVKKRVLMKSPSVASCFDFGVTLPGGMVDTKVGFLVHDYAADFGILRDSNKTRNYLRQLHILQGRLWQLDQLRSSNKNNPILNVNNVELLIKSEKNKDNSIEDLVGELQYEAKRRDIPVFVKNNQQTARHLNKVLANFSAH
ncbi:MAG: hypothetical protein L3J51_02550 [Cocleimonas sp.]|nr:hypothetical protein [Cocleimonas sp.]